MESVADNDQTFEVDAQMDEPCSAEDMCNRPSTADGRDDVTMQYFSLLFYSSSNFYRMDALPVGCSITAMKVWCGFSMRAFILIDLIEFVAPC